ncbi:MAG TPA: hypothetical protein VFS08_12675 [Gemmatimonadaceae bacterium]|nr:hypothetical protein [Gemmatimonadaceae bacterium]
MPASLPARAARRLIPLLAVLGAGCAGAARGTPAAPSPATDAADPAARTGATAEARPLAGLRGQRVLVLPVQHVSADDSLGLRAGALDAELAFALGERGLDATWAGAATARRLAAQNPTYASDPSVLPLSRSRPLRAGDRVEDPLASQLRALVALHDGRYVVIPTELRVDAAGGTRRAVLELALVDARGAEVRWAGATSGVPLDGTPPAARAARIAQQFVDLIAAPREP